MKKKLLTTMFLVVIGFSYAQTDSSLAPLIQNVYHRQIQKLNGYWNYVVDPLTTGYYDYRRKPTKEGFFRDEEVDNQKVFKEYDFDSSPVMAIPGDWNTHSDNLFFYEGTMWFRKKFEYRATDKQRVFLYFGATNYKSYIYLNGIKIGQHTGGYTPFNFEITQKLKSGENKLIVMVDNERAVDAVPTNNFDWFNYGGITRDVMLVFVPHAFIQTYSLHLKKGTTNTIEGNIKLSDIQANQIVKIEIPELKLKQECKTDSNGVAHILFNNIKLQLWSPETPKLYPVKIYTTTDTIKDKIGFRSIETRGNQILLNGKPVFLKGISIHEEAAFRNARIYTAEEDKILLDWAKELGCNYVRLAHYPHNEQMVRLAEQMGLMVWSEIPVYWTIQWQRPDVYHNAENQLDEMIARDKNRANIIIWSIANETPHGNDRDIFLSSLSKYARSKDSTRLIIMAMERKDKSNRILSINDNMSQFVDIISFNQYVGWYDGANDKIDSVRWEIDYNKPIIISEFGGEGVFGLHGDSSQRWTEEYQADLYKKTLKMIDERMPLVSGISPWILKDFRSSRRLYPQLQDGFNRKGVISDKGQRKQAFYILQEWYKKK